MSSYDPRSYGERIAEVYDLLESPNLQTASAVDTLAELAEGGRVLELGVGTGRIALPLAARGLEVDGIDVSPAMLDKLRDKDGADSITLIEGDFAASELRSGYALVFAAYNTFTALEDQNAQVRCMRNVASALRDGGRFVVEVSLPEPARLAKRHDVWLRHVDDRLALFHTAAFDPVEQTVVGQYLLVTDRLVRTYPVRTRYVWPAELDLMARLAGLRREAWWCDWERARFDERATTLVASYRKR